MPVSDSLPLVLGLLALLGSLATTGIALYLLAPRRESGPDASRPGRDHSRFELDQARPELDQAQPAPASEPAAVSSARAPKRPRAPQAHSLFVIFPDPTPETQRALAAWLRKVGARYDSVYEVYNVAGKQPANPVKVANAFPPGTLPDLLAAEAKGGEEAPLRGISLLVKAPLRPSRNQQLHVFVALAMELEALGGQVLDGEKNPATDATYASILGEQ